MKPTPLHWPLLAAGTTALILGVLVYMTDRPPGSAYFLPPYLSLFDRGHPLFGALGAQLPTLLHTFAFSLLSLGMLDTSRRTAALVCAAWALVNALFEIGQHPLLGPHIADAVPAWFTGIPLLENTAPYFRHGHFDGWDIASIGIGAAAAYGIARVYVRHHERQRLPR